MKNLFITLIIFCLCLVSCDNGNHPNNRNFEVITFQNDTLNIRAYDWYCASVSHKGGNIYIFSDSANFKVARVENVRIIATKD